MVTAPLTFALVFSLSALLTPPETGSLRGADRPVAPCLNLWPSLSAHDASELDDEVEIPDEPEDDEPDDAGSAFCDERPSIQILPFDSATSITRPAVATRFHYRASTTAGSEQDRFLRLCRFLI